MSSYLDHALAPHERRHLFADGTLRFRPHDPDLSNHSKRHPDYGKLKRVAEEVAAGKLRGRLVDIADQHGLNYDSLRSSIFRATHTKKGRAA